MLKLLGKLTIVYKSNGQWNFLAFAKLFKIDYAKNHTQQKKHF